MVEIEMARQGGVWTLRKVATRRKRRENGRQILPVVASTAGGRRRGTTGLDLTVQNRGML